MAGELTTSEPAAVPAGNQEQWADRLHYRETSVSNALAQFTVVRDANLRFARQLTPEQLARFGVHSERGGESAEYTLRLLAGHDLVHLDQLMRIRRAVSGDAGRERMFEATGSSRPSSRAPAGKMPA